MEDKYRRTPKADGEAGVIVGIFQRIVWFFQRYAMFFGIFAGLVAARTFVPEDASDWVGYAVCLAVGLPVYLLLYKDRVTANRPKREPNNPFR